ncbi:MAG: UxaA family hydrolase [Chthonomonadales bacterium]
MLEVIGRVDVPGYELADKAIRLHSGDEVAVLRENLPAGTVLMWEHGDVRLKQAIPAGHKVALVPVAEGAAVHKYGQIIGFAAREIRAGDWVHTHNLRIGKVDTRHVPVSVADLGEEKANEGGGTFEGYLRPDGRVGTRNYLAIISTVSCSAETTQMLAARLREAITREFPYVDGVVPITHSSGCAMGMGSMGYRILQRTLAGMADHPNVGAAMIIGLGCETNQAVQLVREIRGLNAGARGTTKASVPVLGIQQLGGIRRTVEAGSEVALRLLKQANRARRSTQPISQLVIGTNCGGSDAYSGITANPALGLAGDEMVRRGATWVLAETPEICGAEHLLAARARDPRVAEALLERMEWWRKYAAFFGEEINNNPSYGNKEGGLSTIYEKALGAVMKAGSSPLEAVYGYGERICTRGLCFMDTPGHDQTSVTGLVAGGCTLIAFTTGRGSCLGFKPAPVLKIATNTPVFQRMEEDMDLDAGAVLHGLTLKDMGRLIFDELVAVASGRQTKSEAQGLGDYEFTPWVVGPVL